MAHRRTGACQEDFGLTSAAGGCNRSIYATSKVMMHDPSTSGAFGVETPLLTFAARSPSGNLSLAGASISQQPPVWEMDLMQCPVCGAVAENISPSSDGLAVRCHNCGEFDVAGSAVDDLLRLDGVGRAAALDKAKSLS